MTKKEIRKQLKIGTIIFNTKKGLAYPAEIIKEQERFFTIRYINSP